MMDDTDFFLLLPLVYGLKLKKLC